MAPETVAVAIGVLGLLGIIALSIPSILFLIRFAKERPGPIRLEDPPVTEYVDEDGEATEESIARFERATRWQGWSINVLGVLGFGISLAQAIIVTCGKQSFVASWVQVAGWVSV